MAISNSSSRSSSKSSSRSGPAVSIKASCYSVDAVTGALSGMQYSSTGAGGPQQQETRAGGDGSNSAAARRQSRPNKRTSGVRRRRGGADTIREECERLFCETLRAVFLGEQEWPVQDSRAMGSHNNSHKYRQRSVSSGTESYDGNNDAGGTFVGTDSAGGAYRKDSGYDEPSDGEEAISSLSQHFTDKAVIETSTPLCPVAKWLEIWDYMGGGTFRGFTTEDPDSGETTMFIFFDEAIMGRDLKKGLMALIDLASDSAISGTRLVVCLERGPEGSDVAASPNKSLMRDLNWVGFELTTLAPWVPGDYDLTSERWLFVGMEV